MNYSSLIISPDARLLRRRDERAGIQAAAVFAPIPAIALYTEAQFTLSNANYSGNISIAASVQSSGAGRVSFMLWSSNGANGINGYLVKFSAIAGEYPVQIFRLVNGAPQDISVYSTPQNAAQLSGFQSLLVQYFSASGQFTASLNGFPAATAADTSYSISGPVGYLSEIVAGSASRLDVSSTPSVQSGSSIISPTIGALSDHQIVTAWGPGGLLNKLINAPLDVWPQGIGPISVSISGAYVPEGFIVTPTGASVSAQQAPGRALTRYSLQIFGAPSVTGLTVKQRIESNMAAPLANQTVTVQAQIGNLNYPNAVAIGTAAATATGSLTITGVTVPAGALIVVIVADNFAVNFNFDGLGPTLGDGTNGPYLPAASGSFNGGANMGGVFYFPNSAALSGGTIAYTRHTSGSSSVAMSAFYVTGIAASAFLDAQVSAMASGSSTAPLVTSGATSAFNELVVGAVMCAGSPTYTQPAGFATPPALADVASGITVAGGVMVAGLGNQVTFAPTLGTSEPWLAFTVGFIPGVPANPIQPKLTIKHPTLSDNYSSALVTDLNAVSLQYCVPGLYTQVAYTFQASAQSLNGLEITWDLGNAFGAAVDSVQLCEFDIRVTPGIPVGINNAPPIPELRPIQTELAFCQRYFDTSYNLGVAPGTITSAGAIGFDLPAAYSYATLSLFFKAKMRANPTVTLYSPGTGATGNIYNNNTASDLAAGVAWIGEYGATAYVNDVSVAVNQGIEVHYIANARL